MKAQKLFSLDIENIERIKELANASKVVNDLLTDYFFSGKHLEREEIEAKLALLEREKDEKIREINALQLRKSDILAKDAEIKAVFREIPAEILNDFKVFPDMTEEILKNRYNDIYKNDKTYIGFETILKAFRKYKEKNA